MTDKVKGCWVLFDEDYREDDAEEITKAIEMIKGVKLVSTSVSDPITWMDRQRIRLEIRDKIFQALEEVE